MLSFPSTSFFQPYFSPFPYVPVGVSISFIPMSVSRDNSLCSPLLVITHIHFCIFFWRLLVVALFTSPLDTLWARRVLCTRWRRKTRRWNARWRNTSRDAWRSSKARRRGKAVCGQCLWLRCAGLQRRIVLAGHFGKGMALLFRIADFLFEYLSIHAFPLASLMFTRLTISLP